MSKRRHVKLDGSYRNPSSFYCETEVVLTPKLPSYSPPTSTTTAMGARRARGFTIAIIPIEKTVGRLSFLLLVLTLYTDESN